MNLFPKALLGSAAALVLSQCASMPGTANTKESYSGILPEIQAPASISYAGETYRAGYSAASSAGATVEYFRAGEGPKNWQRLMALRAMPQKTTPKDQAILMGRSAKAGAAAYSAPNGDVGFDSLIPKSNGGLEFSLFRFAPLPGTEGVKSLQYAEQIPRGNLDVPKLKALVAKHRAAMMKGPFPAISLKAGQ
ncbi:MAG: hypothetical protein JWO82_352 [Akkermansiaceae bacterium]|nr:hypothetical protein [Akkermansiaceae bacterium]